MAPSIPIEGNYKALDMGVVYLQGDSNDKKNSIIKCSV